MRTKICCELATSHHGSLDVALRMIDAAAEAGADAVKIQHYGAVNPKDPQAQWLDESRLHLETIRALKDRAVEHGMEFWATPFDRNAQWELCDGGVDRIKIASTEAWSSWWTGSGRPLVVSWPWGQAPDKRAGIHLTAIPLYPTPLECVYRAPMLDGWSDHTIGLSACQRAIVLKAQWLEVHLTLPGVSRQMSWDKTPEDIKQLRQFAEDVATMETGISQTFRDRWQRSAS